MYQVSIICQYMIFLFFCKKYNLHFTSYKMKNKFPPFLPIITNYTCILIFLIKQMRLKDEVLSLVTIIETEVLDSYHYS